ncbi:hypothetical protein V8C26DRAFT_251678 [Trichoderma gracile]
MHRVPAAIRLVPPEPRVLLTAARDKDRINASLLFRCGFRLAYLSLCLALLMEQCSGAVGTPDQTRACTEVTQPSKILYGVLRYTTSHLEQPYLVNLLSSIGFSSQPSRTVCPLCDQEHPPLSHRSTMPSSPIQANSGTRLRRGDVSWSAGDSFKRKQFGSCRFQAFAEAAEQRHQRSPLGDVRFIPTCSHERCAAITRGRGVGLGVRRVTKGLFSELGAKRPVCTVLSKV